MYEISIGLDAIVGSIVRVPCESIYRVIPLISTYLKYSWAGLVKPRPPLASTEQFPVFHSLSHDVHGSVVVNDARK